MASPLWPVSPPSWHHPWPLSPPGLVSPPGWCHPSHCHPQAGTTPWLVSLPGSRHPWSNVLPQDGITPVASVTLWLAPSPASITLRLASSQPVSPPDCCHPLAGVTSASVTPRLVSPLVWCPAPRMAIAPVASVVSPSGWHHSWPASHPGWHHPSHCHPPGRYHPRQCHPLGWRHPQIHVTPGLMSCPRLASSPGQCHPQTGVTQWVLVAIARAPCLHLWVSPAFGTAARSEAPTPCPQCVWHSLGDIPLPPAVPSEAGPMSQLLPASHGPGHHPGDRTSGTFTLHSIPG